MSTIKKPGPDLTELEIKDYDKRCEDLAKKYGISKVHACVFIEPDSNRRVPAFLKEPNFPTKITVLDKVTTVGIYNASVLLMEATILKEDSDPLTYGEAPECDDYKIGVVNFCIGLIRTKENVYKKK